LEGVINIYLLFVVGISGSGSGIVVVVVVFVSE
jgi:hypothetical protein